MRDSEQPGLSLLSRTLQIWNDHRRGIPQSGEQASVAHCLQHHKEWWSGWATATDTGENSSIAARLLHIHNDAMVRSQLDFGSPREIRVLFDALREKGFTEFECIHTLALAVSEENAYVQEHGGSFNPERYVKKAERYTHEALSRPNLRLARARISLLSP